MIAVICPRCERPITRLGAPHEDGIMHQFECSCGCIVAFYANGAITHNAYDQ